jgi:hypothetical protein
MTPEDFARTLRVAERIGNWVKAVQEYAHAEAVAGRCPLGFKLVAKRAVRKWRDESAVKARLMLDFGYREAEIYVEPKMQSPAGIEKLLGKKRFAAELADDVKKESSGTNLVPVSDAREAVVADAASEFGG